jgi:hypothetical protein
MILMVNHLYLRVGVVKVLYKCLKHDKKQKEITKTIYLNYTI